MAIVDFTGFAFFFSDVLSETPLEIVDFFFVSGAFTPSAIVDLGAVFFFFMALLSAASLAIVDFFLFFDGAVSSSSPPLLACPSSSHN